MFFLDIYSSDNRLTWGPFSSMFDFIHPICSPPKMPKKTAGTWDSFLFAVFSPGGCKTKGEEPYGPEWLELPAGFQGVELAWWGWGWGCHNFVLNDDCLMILLWLGWGCFMHYYHILSWFMHGKDVKYPWNQMNCQFPIWYPWPLPPQKKRLTWVHLHFGIILRWRCHWSLYPTGGTQDVSRWERYHRGRCGEGTTTSIFASVFAGGMKIR